MSVASIRENTQAAHPFNPERGLAMVDKDVQGRETEMKKSMGLGDKL